MLNHAKQLGDVVRKARTAQKLTQAKVAELVDASTRTIHNIEHYKENPKFDCLVPLIRLLNIDPKISFIRKTNVKVQPSAGYAKRLKLALNKKCEI